MKTVLVTGGTGFIGHHVVEHILKNTDWKIVILDRMSSVGTMHRLNSMSIWNLEENRVKIVQCDLRSSISYHDRVLIGDIDYVLHLAANTHVDRSITEPLEFVKDNVLGTCHLLEWARNYGKPARFIYFSTDEVFGPAPEGVEYKEWDRYKSSNPYAATKAGAEELCVAYHNTYKMPIIITHTMNVFGERQDPEKFISLCINKILKGEKIMIHSDVDRKKSGTRFYIHARNVASALLFLLKEGVFGEKYNIVGEKEVSNLDMVMYIGEILHKEVSYEMVDFHSSRAGHDLRYALDGTRLKEMGFDYPKDFYTSLEKTVNWMVDHRRYWL